MARSFLIPALGFSLFVACATKPSAPPAAPAPEAAPAAALTTPPAPLEPAAKTDAVVGPPAVKWTDMTKEQKGKFMKHVVMPKMKATFQAYDADAYKEFTCGTCHGKNPKAVGFKMPTPDLPELPANREGFMDMAQRKPKAMTFMKEQVMPQVAELLGLKHFDPSKPQEGGFGCMGCHTMKKAP